MWTGLLYFLVCADLSQNSEIFDGKIENFSRDGKDENQIITLFRDGQRSTFPRVTENAVAQARKRDLSLKQEHQQNTNSGKYKN